MTPFLRLVDLFLITPILQFCFIHKWRDCAIDEALATRFIDDCVSQAWQLRWDSLLNPLAHVLLALPYLGLTAAKGNNVCQESVKLEPKPTLLFKSQVPTSYTYSQAYLQCQTLISQLIQLGLHFLQISKRDFVNRFPHNSTQNSSSWKKWPLFISFSVQERELTAELVSKIPWSEARDVWLKLGL